VKGLTDDLMECPDFENLYTKCLEFDYRVGSEVRFKIMQKKMILILNYYKESTLLFQSNKQSDSVGKCIGEKVKLN